ncbi:unnamed protein product [Rangifer tarandus platyrhynchus]|uniref:Uncharacterized protein n=1 Tax=Rangifer tarandus platyrhynchus TaxID=3082113 RepID=A0AC60A2D5_RANTA
MRRPAAVPRDMRRPVLQRQVSRSWRVAPGEPRTGRRLCPFALGFGKLGVFVIWPILNASALSLDSPT